MMGHRLFRSDLHYRLKELANLTERAVIRSQGAGLWAPLAEIRPNSGEASDSGTLEQVERDHATHAA
jgi:hypothetical protein